MATANAENIGNIDYEILALFDDVAALSQMENILRNSEFCHLLDMEPIQTPPKMENCNEIKKNKERRNNATNTTTPNQDKENAVFAVPKVYHCMYCDKQFYNQTAVRRHQLNHAKEQLRCPKCRVNSYTSGTLRRHYWYNHDVTRKPIGQLNTMQD